MESGNRETAGHWNFINIFSTHKKKTTTCWLKVHATRRDIKKQLPAVFASHFTKVAINFAIATADGLNFAIAFVVARLGARAVMQRHGNNMLSASLFLHLAFRSGKPSQQIDNWRVYQLVYTAYVFTCKRCHPIRKQADQIPPVQSTIQGIGYWERFSYRRQREPTRFLV